jgi:hypothetical protein
MNPFLNAFETPQAEHTACPFWFWNGDMIPAEIIRQIQLMFEKNIRSFVIHARVGLTVPYLSETWFERCEIALKEAARLGMKVWLYDEDNWPSGYAGGRVLARNPNFVGQNLALEQHYLKTNEKIQFKLERPEEIQTILACRIEMFQPLPTDPLSLQKITDVSHSWSDTKYFKHLYANEAPLKLEPVENTLTWTAPTGHWCIMIFRQQPTSWIATYSDQPYVDLINANATQVFLEETHQRYWQRFESYFTTTILGFFIDEPGFYNNFWTTNVGTLTWTHDLSLEFEQRRGYSLLPCLPALWESVGAYTQVRLDYWKTIAELLFERFFGKIANWCEQHGVMLTGHLHYEEWMFTMTRNSVSPFSALQPFHVPGADKIDEVTDKIVEKLIASVAHAHGRSRVISETFALTGWKLAPPYMKQILDYQFVRGINWITFHGFYYSIKDFRQRECPPSEFFQNPWWNHSQPMWQYVARLSAVLSQGQHVAPVALYYPSEQAQATITPFEPAAMPNTNAWETWQLPEKHLPVQKTDISMIHLGLHLSENQWDYDLIDHSALETSTIKNSQINISNESFRIMIIPEIQTIHASSLNQILAFTENGGNLIFVNQIPEKILAGNAPSTWENLRQKLLGLTQPAFIKFGTGNIGFVPNGIEAVAPLLEQIQTADLRLEIHPSDDRWLSTLENRNAMFRDARIKPLRNTIKYHRRTLDGYDLYFITNESSEVFRATLELRGTGQIERWNPQNGTRALLPSQAVNNNRVRVAVTFGAWESYLLVLTPASTLEVTKPALEIQQQQLNHWKLELATQTFEGALQNWAAFGRSSFSGTGLYSTTFEWDGNNQQSVWLDLGVVLETALITINGTALEPLVWTPYRVEISEQLKQGRNELRIQVANTNANAFEGRERPSGLLGPVWIVSSENV